MHSSKDFYFLYKAGYKKTYDSIDKAMSYYYSDPAVSCSLFRKALESLLSDVYSIVGKEPDGSLKDNTDYLSNIIPDKFYDDNIVLEMTNVRIIGNAQIHDNEESAERDVKKDCQTSYIAMKKIAEWFVVFSDKYPRYIVEQKKLEEEKLKKRRERRKKAAKTTAIGGGILAGIVGLVALILKKK